MRTTIMQLLEVNSGIKRIQEDMEGLVHKVEFRVEAHEGRSYGGLSVREHNFQ